MNDKLKLPLEIGKRYRVINEGSDEGVHEWCAREDGECIVCGWFCDAKTGAVIGVEGRVHLEGPIE